MLPHLDFRLNSYQKNHISPLNLFEIFKVLKESTQFGALKEMFEIREMQLLHRHGKIHISSDWTRVCEKKDDFPPFFIITTKQADAYFIYIY